MVGCSRSRSDKSIGGYEHHGSSLLAETAEVRQEFSQNFFTDRTRPFVLRRPGTKNQNFPNTPRVCLRPNMADEFTRPVRGLPIP
jgi:hypothetical protein